MVKNSKNSNTTNNNKLNGLSKTTVGGGLGVNGHHQYIPDVGGHVPEDTDQWLVQTPYGEGLVIRTRQQPKSSSSSSSTTATTTIREIELTTWNNVPVVESSVSSSSSSSSSFRKPSMLYTSIEYPSIPIEIGSEVICIYGRGKVINIIIDSNTSDSTDNNKCYIIRISSWRLANRSTVVCYINNVQNAKVRVVRTKKVYEMSIYEKIEKSYELKNNALQYFIKKQYNDALHYYTVAIDTVRYIQHVASTCNEIRADLLNILITCNNNASLCCYNLLLYNDSLRYSKSSEVLVQALYEKTSINLTTSKKINGTSTGSSNVNGTTSKIHSILNKDGISDIKLFGEYRVKSMLLSAKALYELGSIDESISYCKQSKEIIEQFTTDKNTNTTTLSETDKVSYKNLESNLKEINKVIRLCKEKKKKILEKEKLRARAMFGGGSSTSSTNTSNGKTNSTVINGSNGINGISSISNGTTNGILSNTDDNNSTNGGSTTSTASTTAVNCGNGTKINPILLSPKSTRTTILSSESASPLTPNTLKKKVTFSEKIQVKNFINTDNVSGTSNNSRSVNSINNSSSNNNHAQAARTNKDYNNIIDDQLDTEAVLGLLFVGSLIGVGLTAATFMFLNRKR